MEVSPDSRVSTLIRRMAELEAELQSCLGRPVETASPTVFPADLLPESRYRRLVDRLPLLLFELAPDGSVLFVNAAITAATGFLPEELLGESWWAVFCPRELSRQAAELKNQLQAGDVTRQEMILQTRSGELGFFELTSANWYDAAGRLERVVGMAADVSRWRRAEAFWQAASSRFEQRLEERTADLRRVIEQRSAGQLGGASDRLSAELEGVLSSMADGVVLFSEKGDVLRLNPAASRLFGKAAEAFRQLPAGEVSGYSLERPDGLPLPAGDWPPHRALDGETVQGQIVVLRTPEVEKKWLTISAAPCQLPDGRHFGVVATVSDITSLRTLQEKQEIYLQTISHDLRAPLAVLYGHTQLLQNLLGRQGLEKESQPNIDAILQGVERMNAMIGDLVDAARLEGGELILKREALNLADFTARLLQDSHMVLEVDRIHCEIPEGLPPVWADPDRLERILLNLLSNAQKYSNVETPVRIGASEINKHVVVEVIDCGHGIAAQDLPSIFERFNRPQGQRKADSVGLGLYITKMLVESHQGQIWVNSLVGEGSTFFFSLPQAEPGRKGDRKA